MKFRSKSQNHENIFNFNDFFKFSPQKSLILLSKLRFLNISKFRFLKNQKSALII